MSRGWPLVPLGEVLQLQRRWVEVQPTDTYREIGIRSFGKGIFHKAPVVGSSLGDKRVLRIEPGDLVFNNVFAWEGAVAVAGHGEDGMIGSHRFITYTVDPSKAVPEYLKLFFKTKGGLEILLGASPGSAGRNKTLGLERFISNTIPLPPLSEQGRLVTSIGELTGKIEEAKKLLQESSVVTEALSASVLSQIIDQDPWPHLSIESLVGRANLKNGKSLKGTDLPSNIQCLTLSALRGGTIDCSQSKPVPMTVEEATPYLVRDGDVFVVRGNGSKALVGRAGLVQETRPGTIFPDLFIKVPLDPKVILGSYFVEVWNSRQVRNVIEDRVRTTSGIWKINQAQLAAILIPVPPLNYQEEAIGRFSALHAKLHDLSKTRAQASVEIKALMPVILDQAFEGIQ
jgi:type I restriction enzyme S subunit